MYQALYRKWRPQTFDDVCGQEHITSILKYETENNKFSHAYLFCGSRGTGKTTCAKILAKAVNCLSPVNGSPCNCCESCRSIDAGTATDVLEMDAASNNGVDNIRDIRDEVVYTPSALKYRVYIVDEVHMLSPSAFNALLKTLEEPPAHALFILATTELNKLPATIISRCQRYDFRRIATDTLVNRLKYISDREKIEYTPDALRIIAKMAQGGMRDAISLLELCAASREKITPDVVNNTLGVGGRESVEKVVKAIAASDFDTIFAAVDEVVRSSRDILVFWQDLTAFYRDMLVSKTCKSAENYLDLADGELEHLKNAAALFTKDMLMYHCRILDDTYYAIQKAGAVRRTVAEMALIKMCDMSLETTSESISARLSKLESTVAAFSQPLTVSEQIAAQTSEKTEAFENKRENGAKSEEKAEKQSANSSGNPSANSSGIYSGKYSMNSPVKVLRGWSEICERAAEGDGATLGLIAQAKALTDGTRIYIRFPNDYARSMADKPKIREALRAAICVSMKKQIKSEDMEFGIFEGNEDSLSDLDDLSLD